MTAVLGANGAGKTSLLRTITGLVRPSSGSVKLAGEDVTRLPVEEIVRRGMAHVPEGRGVIAELTVAENLRLGGLWRGREAAPLSEIYELFPRLEERERPAGIEAVGRRAADALDRAGAGRTAARAAARRAVAGARAGAGGADHGDGPQAGRHARAGGAAGRAERPQRAVDRQPRDRAEPRRVVAEQDPDKLIADDQLLHAYLGF